MTKLNLDFFKSARIKLTTSYTLVALGISLFFSTVIYLGAVRNLEQSYQVANIRLHAAELEIQIPNRIPKQWQKMPENLREKVKEQLFETDLAQAKTDLQKRLAFLNGLIFLGVAGTSYFLAGKTLKPIEKNMEDQKRFISDASHELKTPLTALKTSLEVGLRVKKPTIKRLQENLKESLEEVDRLTNLTEHLLKLNQFQNNGQAFKKTKVDLGLIAKRAVKTISPLAKKKGVKIKTSLKKAVLQASPEGLNELITILLDNAIKFTPKNGQVTVTNQSLNNKIFLTVSDTGIGINKKDLPHLFERFYRTDESRHTKGFGLGLSLAKQIVDLHQGSIKVKSEPKKGSTFTISLPLK